MKATLKILLFATLLLTCPFILKAEEILLEGNFNFLSAQNINSQLFILYSTRKGEEFGKIFVRGYDLKRKRLTVEKDLEIKGISAYLSFFNNRFYVAYTSLVKEGDIRIAEFDHQWNLLRDVPLISTPYEGEVAHSLIPQGDSLYLFYARNWGKNCGLKVMKLNRYLEPTEEITLIKGEPNFHIYFSEFSPVLVNGKFYISYRGHSALREFLAEEIKNLKRRIGELKTKIKQVKEELENLKLIREVYLKEANSAERIEILEKEIEKKKVQLESLSQDIYLKEEELRRMIKSKKKAENISVMSIFVNEYSLKGNLYKKRHIGGKESLSPSLLFEGKKFYLAYEEYDEKLAKPVIYVNVYDENWNLLKRTKIITLETGQPRAKKLIIFEGKCYLISVSENRNPPAIYLKKINFDLKEDKVNLNFQKESEVDN